MPQPGSKGYENQRRGLRNRYDQQGTPDRHATEAANEQLQGGRATGSAAAATDRVAGPAGERSAASGDPGAVLTLRTSAFSDHDLVPDRYSRDGGNVPPPLEWRDVPAGTAELVLLVEDPDAPGGTFVHWVVTGIDPDLPGLPDGAPPGATEWRNDFDDRGYGGPQPPVGDEPHRYVFRLYALPERCELSPEAGVDALREHVTARASATGTVVGRFGR